jgi:hypothetical protein
VINAYVMVAQLVETYGTRWKVEDSISDNVITIFHGHNSSGRTMALQSTQPLTEMSTRNISWGINHLTPNGHFSGRTAPLTYICCIFFYLFNRYTY